MPRRPPNRDLRTREHLTEAEVERLMKAMKDNRYGHRDATMILVACRRERTGGCGGKKELVLPEVLEPIWRQPA
jgi:hypothetical protein